MKATYLPHKVTQAQFEAGVQATSDKLNKLTEISLKTFTVDIIVATTESSIQVASGDYRAWIHKKCIYEFKARTNSIGYEITIPSYINLDWK